jgi:hypothetical protein
MQMKRQLRERELQQKDHLARLGQCLELERWNLERGTDGGMVVRAEVRAGREGRLALDAHADQGSDEVLVPDVQRAPLLPAPVRAGEELVLERHLRRVRPGEPDAISLRFSCRPPGPVGVFGVVEYSTGVTREGSDGFGNVVRPLPPSR